MAIREVDAISDAIIATEREIAGEAWGQEETDALDETGDRSHEDLGEGLEGQHEAGDEIEDDGEDADGDEEVDGEGDDEGKGQTEAEIAAAAKAAGEPKPAARTEPEGRVPPGRYREVAERARAAEAERDALKAEMAKAGETKTLADKLDLALREIDNLKRAPRTEPKAVEPPKAEVVPDIFEDPKGFADHITRGFQTELAKRDAKLENARVENSMAIAHGLHKETFEKAFDAINKLDPRNPDDRSAVQRIYNSPNPGDALVNWHKRQQTLAEVGDDPTAYRARVAEETRAALLKDPEFRKQLIADLRGEANAGDDGTPRTTTRLPRSLSARGGSNLGADRSDARVSDDSEQSVADAAWR